MPYRRGPPTRLPGRVVSAGIVRTVDETSRAGNDLRDEARYGPSDDLTVPSGLTVAKDGPACPPTGHAAGPVSAT